MTGLVSAGADLASTTLTTVAWDIARVTVAAVFITGILTVIWTVRAAVRGWKRIRPPVDVDPALARPISEDLRQAIAERESGNG